MSGGKRPAPQERLAGAEPQPVVTDAGEAAQRARLAEHVDPSDAIKHVSEIGSDAWVAGREVVVLRRLAEQLVLGMSPLVVGREHFFVLARLTAVRLVLSPMPKRSR